MRAALFTFAFLFATDAWASEGLNIPQALTIAAEQAWHEGPGGYWTRLVVAAIVPFFAIFLATFLAYRNAKKIYEKSQQDHHDNAIGAILSEIDLNGRSIVLVILRIRINVEEIVPINEVARKISLPEIIVPSIKGIDGNASELGRVPPNVSSAILRAYVTFQTFNDAIESVTNSAAHKRLHSFEATISRLTPALLPLQSAIHVLSSAFPENSELSDLHKSLSAINEGLYDLSAKDIRAMYKALASNELVSRPYV